MHSAKQLKRNRDEWAETPPSVTIFVVGWSSNPTEPLLLEALANHPGCKKLYFVPLDGVHGDKNEAKFKRGIGQKTLMESRKLLGRKLKPDTLYAYDVTDTLALHGKPSAGAHRVAQNLSWHFSCSTPDPVLTTEANILMNGTGDSLLDDYIIRRNPELTVENNTGIAHVFNDKTMLPTFQNIIEDKNGLKVVADCATVCDLGELYAFMDEKGYDQIVLKEGTEACGHGIYRIWRDDDNHLMGEIADRDFKPTDEHPRVFSLTEHFFGPPMLAMEWLDTSKGDMRVIVQNGDCIAAYTRMPPTDSWLCNYHQGATIHPVDMRRDLSRDDRKRMQAAAKMLQSVGIGRASIDFLANAKGERFLSEINFGNTDDIMEIEAHWGRQNAAFGRLPIADQIASDIMHAHYKTVVRQQIEQHMETRMAQRGG